MFSKLSEYVKNLYEKIEEVIKSNKIQYEISERCQKHFSIVNKALFLGMESI